MKMDLWVRSQDKMKLIPINDELYIPNSRTGEDYGVFYRETMLGYYKTEKRALEVLDEIQALLQLKINYKPIVQEEYNTLYPYKNFVKVDDNMEIKELSTVVYEMPKE